MAYTYKDTYIHIVDLGLLCLWEFKDGKDRIRKYILVKK